MVVNMRLFFFTLIIFRIFIGYSQKTNVEVIGYVKIFSEIEFLKGARVTVMDKSEPTNQTIGISQINGSFSVIHPTNDSLIIVKIQFPYCLDHETFFKLRLDNSRFNLDTVSLQYDNRLLDIVSVQSRPNDVIIRQDSITYNAANIQLASSATAEELLRLLPGIEITLDGEITLNGIIIDKILINGKSFFGDDLTIATKNIKKEQIALIEITNTISNQEKLVGLPNNSTTKTINLILKDEYSQGYFGQISSGVGFNERYNQNGFINYFGKKIRITGLVGANNINIQNGGFNSRSADKGLESFGSLNGLIESKYYGLDLSYQVNDRFLIDLNYKGNFVDYQNLTTINSSTFLPIQSYNSVQESMLNNGNRQHSFNLNLDWQFNQNTLLTFRTFLNIAKHDDYFFSNQDSYNSFQELVNNSSSNLYSKSLDVSYKNRLEFTRLFENNGASITLSIAYDGYHSLGIDSSKLESKIIAASIFDVTRNLKSITNQKNNHFEPNVKIAIPIAKKKLFFILNLDYKNKINFYENSSYDYSLDSSYNTSLNFDLSYHYKMQNSHYNIGSALQLKNKKINLNFKLNYFLVNRKNEDYLRSYQDGENLFSAPEFNFNLTYYLNSKSSFSGNYNLLSTPPELQQLLIFPNVNNPINIITGNPNLTIQKLHRLNVSFNHYNNRKQVGFFSFVRLDIKDDFIIRTINIDENFIRKTSYVNVDGSYSLMGNLSLVKKVEIDSGRSMNFKFGLNASKSEEVNMTNGLYYPNYFYTLKSNFNFGFNFTTKLLFSVVYDFFLIQTSYELIEKQRIKSIIQNIHFGNSYLIVKNLVLENYLQLTHFSNQLGFSGDVAWLWNSSITYSLEKPKIDFSIRIFDVLDQNINNERTSMNEVFVETISSALERYLMFGVSWRFNKN